MIVMEFSVMAICMRVEFFEKRLERFEQREFLYRVYLIDQSISTCVIHMGN